MPSDEYIYSSEFACLDRTMYLNSKRASEQKKDEITSALFALAIDRSNETKRKIEDLVVYQKMN